ncbi:hypothetical protein SAMN02910384_03103 [Pseudobutyrivibrio sp. ACV-2]|uniref:hypothetical protein n=1 Tax=Pseudobutyrivibrio sp. ACV-2 TaxID=1520801 RepID=UPI00089D3FE1|nr:hypothetical protein [Pseudobutyrivibrio sp. ACV-2]SEB02425.1 hypothetical protein SAMN02910384_03103 [Pseudobutyrivibrio sp. ACV-2]
MIDVAELIENWASLLEAKADFAYGEDEIYMEDYLDCVKETYDVITMVYDQIENDSKLSPDLLMSYFNLIELVSMYAAPTYMDESENHSFAVSRIIAEELAAIAANYIYAKEDEAEPFEEGIISSVAGFEYEIERVLYYDVNKKDLSDFQELAEAIGF